MAGEQIELGSTVGGELNQLDLIEYGYGIEKTDEGREKVEGGHFAGYFKRAASVDTSYGQHRGSASGIPQQDPRFNQRSLAMYELDKFFSVETST